MVRDWSGLIHSFSNAIVDDFRSSTFSYGETLNTSISLKLTLFESGFLNNSIRKRLWRLNLYFRFNNLLYLSFNNLLYLRKYFLYYRRHVWFYKTSTLALPYFFNQNTNLLSKFPVSLFVFKGILRLVLLPFNKVNFILISGGFLLQLPVSDVERVLQAHSDFKYLRTVFSKPYLTLLNTPSTLVFPWGVSPLNLHCLGVLLFLKHPTFNFISNTPLLNPPFDPTYLKPNSRDKGMGSLSIIKHHPLTSHFRHIGLLHNLLYLQLYKVIILCLLNLL